MITLTEFAKMCPTPLQRGIVTTIAMTSPVTENLPFVNVKGNAYQYNSEQSLPNIAFRDINSNYTESTGIVQNTTENLKVLGGLSQVDRVLVKCQGDKVSLRAQMDGELAKAAALDFTKYFFKGDATSDAKSFNGLEKRITGSQLFDMDGALTLAKLDEMIDAVQGGASMLFMSKAMRRKLNALMRAAGQATEVVTDSFGRQINAYASIPIGIVERDAKGNEILGFNEPVGESGSEVNTCSIYAVKFGAMTDVSGLQCGELEVIDQGLQGVHYTTAVEWICSLAIFNGRSAARLSGITDA